MSTLSRAFLVCDYCFDEYDGSAQEASILRKMAKDEGWFRGRWKGITGGTIFDICGACVKRGPL